jgi:hypothetical protein
MISQQTRVWRESHVDTSVMSGVEEACCLMERCSWVLEIQHRVSVKVVSVTLWCVHFLWYPKTYRAPIAISLFKLTYFIISTVCRLKVVNCCSYCYSCSVIGGTTFHQTIVWSFHFKFYYWRQFWSRKLRSMAMGVPPCWPRDTPLSTKVGTKIHRPVVVDQLI